ncbi:DNA (cytosine-5-)-methyltransferase family protein [Rhynchospora pubera]|uniref:Cytosine-specific methyltransferase n=1 Tax=Rhynchospora pubera TaxID=906938 RepID=A0AAV8CG71_9POAL|nr:DNA (cytosine-5-)-methyltransferase family protein [Rhynchospora pubera]
METTPVVGKRQLRQRKPPVAPAEPDFDSEEEARGRSKRIKTTSRSIKKEKTPAEPELESIPANGDDVAAQGNALGSQSSKGGRGKSRSTHTKRKTPKSSKAKAESVVAGDKKKKSRSVVKGDAGSDQIEKEEEEKMSQDEEEAADGEAEEANEPAKRVAKLRKFQASDAEDHAELVGDPIADAVARERWPHRYRRKESGSSSLGNERMETPEDIRARRHYDFCKVDGVMFELMDDAFVKAEDGQPDYICRIVEIFEGIDGKPYFTAQWFFRAEDTVLKECGKDLDKRRLFLSEDRNDNPLDCIGSKLKIVRVEPNTDLNAKSKRLPEWCNFYYDMSYSVAYSTFENISPEIDISKEVSTSIVSSESANKEKKDTNLSPSANKTLRLLDIYSGCGGMSTGLCLGAALAGINLETTWAVDLNPDACQSLQINHPKTHVRNEKAEYFLSLLKEWEQLVDEFNVKNEHVVDTSGDLENSDSEEDDGTKLPKGVFEVAKLLNICYGDPQNTGTVGVKFLVHWKGYTSEDDTWEPIDGLCDAKERIKEFVVNGYKRNILPLPGTVDVICGGPPCQGISGFNRFRNGENPLEDEKNQQMLVFVDIVKYLKPRYVLMENVVDILKFSKGYLCRFAMASLVDMKYQARLGLLAAGAYGLPQFRMRVFLFGAHPSEILPQFPLPTHNVILRGRGPTEFEPCLVALDENADRSVLKDELLLGDAISELPEVTNDELREEMPYGEGPTNEFQRYIRMSRRELLDYSFGDEDQGHKLYDHQPLCLNEDDFARVCKIPKRKGSNFRDLDGVKVGPDNICYLDPEIPRPLLPSGKPLVPDYAISHLKGKSLKCFGRLWWDETVPTVVTRAEPHNQIIIHPEQDRVLTIRENARLQGFPDYYKFSGPIKQRYIQVGNAVAVPVGRALGYGLGRAFLKIKSDGPVFSLPSNFSLVGQVPQPKEGEVVFL